MNSSLQSHTQTRIERNQNDLGRNYCTLNEEDVRRMLNAFIRLK